MPTGDPFAFCTACLFLSSSEVRSLCFQCNNPMTKEPKLDAAVRIVPEWQDYDQEIKQLQNLFQKEKEMGTLRVEKTQEGECEPGFG